MTDKRLDIPAFLKRDKPTPAERREMERAARRAPSAARIKQEDRMAQRPKTNGQAAGHPKPAKAPKKKGPSRFKKRQAKGDAAALVVKFVGGQKGKTAKIGDIVKHVTENRPEGWAQLTPPQLRSRLTTVVRNLGNERKVIKEGRDVRLP